MPKQILNGLDLTNTKISNLADGSNPTDAVTKQQLDAIARGLKWKNSVKAATTTNITLSGTQTVDGVALVAGDRVLAKDQTTGSANGIYVVAAGAWSRSSDFDDATEVTTAVVIPVEQGTVNADKAFILTTDGTLTVGTTSLAFTPLGGASQSYTAGSGLSLSGSAFSVVPKSGAGLTSDGTGVGIDPAYSGLAKRYAIDVPSGSTTPTITHGLGTLDVLVEVYDKASGAKVEPDVIHTSTTVVTLMFGVSPTTGQYRVVVFG
jgi:hypothetical protein